MLARWLGPAVAAFAFALASMASAEQIEGKSQRSPGTEPAATDDAVTNPPQLRTVVAKAPQSTSDDSDVAGSAHDGDGQPQKTKFEWYGWQTLAVDGPVIVMMPFFVGYEYTTATYLDLGIYTVGAPIVHFAKGEVGRGLGSLGLRGLMVTLGVLAYRNYIDTRKNCDHSFGSQSEFCGFGVMAAGGLGLLAMLGMGGAVAIDAAVLARHDVPVRGRTHAGIQYVPNFLISHDSALVTVGGTF
jgi:hypothetical protein